MTQISIITPAYIDTPEKADWLKETVQSVQAQDFTDWEMIVVDDASPLALDLPDDPRVRVVRAAQNSKPSLCRNTAAALARSECLLPLDADDRLPAGALRVMFELWNEDRKRVVYGDMQRLEPQESGGYDLGKEVKFPPYEFQRTLDFRGTIPVTAMHSKEAHTRAGGWKEEFDAGLEDVEYWISCGLAGFCGYHIDHVTLYYRRSQQNRSWHMRRTNQREGMMRNIIYQMHENIYEGRDYPMSCCGGKGGVRVNRGVANQASAQFVPPATSLDQVAGGDKVWVEYQGKRQAAFGVRGGYSRISYTISGTGHKFEVHVQDLPIFRRSGRGADFRIGVAPPEDRVVQEAPKTGIEYDPPPPEMATIERLDEVASAEQPAQREATGSMQPKGTGLDALNLGALQPMLEADGWTLERLAEIQDVSDLITYRGIGMVRAAQIMNKAKELAK
jgi:hypothetical protein